MSASGAAEKIDGCATAKPGKLERPQSGKIGCPLTRTSGEYLFCVLLIVPAPSHIQEPAENPGRLKACPLDAVLQLAIVIRMADLPPYLHELDRLLLDQCENWMLSSHLDGYLTGIVVSPDMVVPSDWMHGIWAGDDGEGEPEFERMEDFEHMISLIMQHYNEVRTALAQPGSYEPLFDVDTLNDDILWEMWIEGFVQAMDLAPDGWHRIAASADAGSKGALKGITKLHAIAIGKSRLSRSKADQWTQEAPDLIPKWVEMLHAWRLANDPSQPQSSPQGKVGRNDPCPCGSGRKYKKCCGLK